MFKKIVFLALLPIIFIFNISPFISLVFAEEIVISGNGNGSINEAIIEISNNQNITQINSIDVVNNITTSAITGGNNVSDSIGGDVLITTGDVITNITVENEVNNSIVENNCCDPNNSSVLITGNGSNSENSVAIVAGNNNSITTSQTVKVENKVNGMANTGNNIANNNTSGNITLDTGDVKVRGTINNIANTYFVKSAVGSGGYLATISENGTDSKNNIDANLGGSNNINVNNNYISYNFVDWDLNTGGNEASGNTGGFVSIRTGNIFFDFLISNTANIGGVDVECCGIDDPDDPDDPDDLDDPSDPDDPYNPPVGGGNGSTSGSVGGSSTAVNGPQILGLSATSSK